MRIDPTYLENVFQITVDDDELEDLAKALRQAQKQSISNKSRQNISRMSDIVEKFLGNEPSSPVGPWKLEPGQVYPTAAQILDTEDTPKMLRETFCVAQTRIGESDLDVEDRKDEHIARLGRLIDECDRHRPLGPDGRRITFIGEEDGEETRFLAHEEPGPDPRYQ